MTFPVYKHHTVAPCWLFLAVTASQVASWWKNRINKMAHLGLFPLLQRQLRPYKMNLRSGGAGPQTVTITHRLAQTKPKKIVFKIIAVLSFLGVVRVYNCLYSIVAIDNF